MKQTKKALIWQSIILGTILVAIFACIFIKKENISATEIIGKQQNYNIETEEPATIGIEQNVEKYIKLEGAEVLLQQKIIVTSNKDSVDKEKLEIKVPDIQEKQPQKIVVLADGKRLATQNYNYDAENKQLNIENTRKVKTYKIIYTYPETEIKQEEIQLSTKAQIKVESQEEVEAKDEQTITIQETGEAVSIEEKMTKETYKGYLYEAKENETIYGENYIIEVSNTQNEEEMEITKEREIYTYEEQGTKIENGTNQSTYFKQTSINKEQMIDILGDDRNNNNYKSTRRHTNRNYNKRLNRR